MHSRSVILWSLCALLVGATYSSFSTLFFVAGEIRGGVSCSPQGGGKTYCCASVDEGETYGAYTTYCTTCDDTNPPSNCSPREKPTAIVNPGSDLTNMLEGGVLEEPKTQPKLSEDVFPKGGGVLEQEENNNTFSKSNVPFPTANDSDDE